MDLQKKKYCNLVCVYGLIRSLNQNNTSVTFQGAESFWQAVAHKMFCLYGQ